MSSEIISRLYESGVLVTKEVMGLIHKGYSYETIVQLVQKPEPVAPVTVSKTIDESSFPESHVNVQIVKSYTQAPKEITVQDFISHFSVRLQKLSNMLRRRSELENVISINRIFSKTASEKVSVIGFVKEKSVTKNEHIALTIEDKTGEIRVLVLKKEGKEEVYDIAKNLVFDDVVGICGMNTDGKDRIIFADTILLPDIPNITEFKKCSDECYAVFISDLHIGAKVFLDAEFDDFLEWLNQRSPDPALNLIASKVRYLFIVGDVIEGAGVYPKQDLDLRTIDVRDQYKEAAVLLSRIPKHIHVLLCPGNHDVMRLSEPQPPLYTEYAKDILEIPNIQCVSSPSLINIHKYDGFAGFNVLMYHGYSYFYYLDNVEEIRHGGGINSIDLVMEYLLRRRHLAPSHTSTLYMPDHDGDELVIETIPDFFASGHVHKSAVRNVKSTTLLNCSCFVDVTDYQKKQGIVPDLAKVAVVNLQTREVKVIDFLHKKL